jgi:hypothetical protein
VGCRTATRAIAEAQDRGMTPEDVFALAAFYANHRGAWESAGVIREAISTWLPGDDPHAWSTWPSTKPGYDTERRRRDEVAILAAQATADRERREQEAEEAARLEAAYGAELDGLPPEAIERLRQLAGVGEAFVAKYRRPGTVRLMMLMALAKFREELDG